METPNHILSRRFRSGASPLCFMASVLAGLCLVVGTGLAGGEGEAKQGSKKEVKFEPKKKSETDRKTVVTGSLIPQKVKLNRIPVTSSPVIIIGRQDIERSGGSTVAEVLRRQGASR